MELRPELPPLPERIKRLPLDPDRGYPVPWFVAWIEGKPDFRVIRPNGREQALQEKRCWICGSPTMGTYKAFTIGPMCAINRVSAEPPAHLDCATFAAKACPFLVRPHAKRREEGMPEGVRDADGMAISRNPGVTLVWVTKKFFLIGDGKGGWLIRVGEPTAAYWYAEGRTATRGEVEASVESGLPILQQMAELDGPEAITALEILTKEARKYFPSAIVLA